MRITATRAAATVLAAAAVAVPAGHQAAQAFSSTPSTPSARSSATAQPTTTQTVRSTVVITGTNDTFSKDRLTLSPYRSPIGGVITPYSTMEAFLTATLLDVDATWKRYFRSWGYKSPSVRYLFPNGNEGTALGCSSRITTSTAEYCPSTDQITISQVRATGYWNGQLGNRQQAGTGDMSVAVVVAHEYGHNIVRELGLKVSASQNERLADCFAGFWAFDAGKRGILNTDDYKEAYASRALVADPAPGGTHGTVSERQNAFYLGMTQGAVGCVRTFT